VPEGTAPFVLPQVLGVVRAWSEATSMDRLLLLLLLLLPLPLLVILLRHFYGAPIRSDGASGQNP
jgi:hypothetical protein